MKGVVYILILYLIPSVLLANNVATLNIVITNIKNTDGYIHVGLYSSKSQYDDTIFKDKTNTYRQQKIKVTDVEMQLVISNLPYGEYAVGIRHDENDNDKLDRGFFGIPVEGYCFSNNAAGFFGPATYDQAKFIIDTDIITMNLKMK